MNKALYKKRKAKIDEIAAKHGGVLRPEDVVREATSPKSILHGCFEWDDKKAGHQFRLDQARQLIASVKYTYTVEMHTYSAPEWVRDPTQEERDQGYVNVKALRTDKELSRDALIGEFGRAASHLARAHEIAKALEFKPKEVQVVIDKVTRLIGHAEEMTLAN
jgi:hypothetical protein